MALYFRVTATWYRRSLLLLASVAIVVIWCGVLPWVATTPCMRTQLQFLDDRGIDPSAMFYTELEAMDEILKKQNVR